MRRREFITLLGGTAAAWPLPARAQQAMPVIGFVGSSSPERFALRQSWFERGLGEAGYIDGKNVSIEYRWAYDRNDVLPSLVTSLVRRPVAVIATTGGTPTALAAKAATTSIPIVFHLGANPVELGLVVSLNRPSGNLTGVTTLNVEMAPKRLELIHELVPKASKVALFTNPTNSSSGLTISRVEDAARRLGVDLVVLHAASERDVEAAFAQLGPMQVQAIVINTDPLFLGLSAKIGKLAERNAVPAIHGERAFAVAGGLMSYGSSLAESHRQAGYYVGVSSTETRPRICRSCKRHG